MLYRRYMGHEKKAEKAKLDDGCARSTWGTRGWTNNDDRNEVATLIQTISDRFKAIAADKQIGQDKIVRNYEDALKRQAEVVADARKALPPLTENSGKAEELRQERGATPGGRQEDL